MGDQDESCQVKVLSRRWLQHANQLDPLRVGEVARCDIAAGPHGEVHARLRIAGRHVFRANELAGLRLFGVRRAGRQGIAHQPGRDANDLLPVVSVAELVDGKRILFSWNGSTESARAISLAMPMLKEAESIEVLSVDGAMVPGPSAAEIADVCIASGESELRKGGIDAAKAHFALTRGRSNGESGYVLLGAEQMNERIKELIKEATEEEHYYGCYGDNCYANELNPEKFAELIIRECLHKIKTCQVPVGNKPALLMVRNEIKAHFGIK